MVGVISLLWCAARLVGIAHHSFYSVGIIILVVVGDIFIESMISFDSIVVEFIGMIVVVEVGIIICDPFWENPYKRGHQLFLFFFTYRIYGARGPRLPSLTEITQVFFELWIKTFMHNRSIIISRFRENAF